MKQVSIYVKLPHLQSKWPQLRKQVGESKYGFSEDDDLVDTALDELLSAHEDKDIPKMMSALEALIRIIKEKGSKDAVNT